MKIIKEQIKIFCHPWTQHIKAYLYNTDNTTFMPTYSGKTVPLIPHFFPKDREKDQRLLTKIYPDGYVWIPNSKFLKVKVTYFRDADRLGLVGTVSVPL